LTRKSKNSDLKIKENLKNLKT